MTSGAGAGNLSPPALLARATQQLHSIEPGDARLEAELLFLRAIGRSRAEWLRDPRRSEPVDASTQAAYDRLLARRLAREPLDYILGSKPFCEIELEVGPGVLVPRSDSEALVEEITRWARAHDRETAAPHQLIDVGTGSGAILLALLTRFPAWRGIGIDVSEAAASWARRNVIRLGLADRATIARGDLLRGRADGSAWIVAANLPYVAESARGDLAPEITEHEPASALFGGADGLDLVRKFLPEAVRVVVPGGLLALELGSEQTELVARWLAPEWREVRVFRDLAGRPRGVVAER